jgi:hypothetical protein
MFSLFNALIVGLLVILMGYISILILGFFVPKITPELPDICKSWNDNHTMEISLFITGILTYSLINYLKL